jgi:hypothetical protein
MLPRLSRVLAASCALSSPAALASTARLLTTDAAEPLGGAAVIGLQRVGVSLPYGFELETAPLADLALLPNLGVRWAGARGPHRIVVGARYALFAGTSVYSDVVHGQEPQVVRFEPAMNGPAAYAVYGFEAGPFLAQLEARYSGYGLASFSTTAAVVFFFGDERAPSRSTWGVVLEAGYRFVAPTGTPPLRAAAGVRFVGEHFGLTLGAAYVGLSEILFPQLPMLPVLDLSWTF